MQVIVAGIADRNTDHLLTAARAAIEELGVDGEVVLLSDHDEITALGVTRTPGVVVDGRVVADGRVPSTDEVREILSGALAG